MGMTDDFEIAVEEGATIVRVGRALFGERRPPRRSRRRPDRPHERAVDVRGLVDSAAMSATRLTTLPRLNWPAF